MTFKKLLKKLEKAHVVCYDCGINFGTPRGGCSSFWVDTCDVCGTETPVTEVRDYSYLKRGIEEISKKL
jgi:translation initiation factor 2 beta subunit (eIF-2beta)/eIF-5